MKEEVRQLADQYTDPESAIFKEPPLLFFLPVLTLCYSHFNLSVGLIVKIEESLKFARALSLSFFVCLFI